MAFTKLNKLLKKEKVPAINPSPSIPAIPSISQPNPNSLNKQNLQSASNLSFPQPNFQAQINKPMNFSAQPNLNPNKKKLSDKQEKFLHYKR
jgi:hypothetical protein